MSDAISTSSPQWVDVDFFHQALPALLPGKQTDLIGGMSSLSPESMLSPMSVDSSKMSGGSSPKRALKPIRRRSRASKRTSTTHLNASPTKFRALVQQFTGCPSAPLSLEAAKGPVTLDFAPSYNYQYQLPAQQLQDLYQQQQHLDHPQQLLHQQRNSPFDNNNMNNVENEFFSTSGSPNYMESYSGNFDADGSFLQAVPRDYSTVIENFNNHGKIN